MPADRSKFICSTGTEDATLIEPVHHFETKDCLMNIGKAQGGFAWMHWPPFSYRAALNVNRTLS
jgi:hypothetical protein